MIFNKQYIQSLFEKKKFGEIIKLILLNKYVWSKHEYRILYNMIFIEEYFDTNGKSILNRLTTNIYNDIYGDIYEENNEFMSSYITHADMLFSTCDDDNLHSMKYFLSKRIIDKYKVCNIDSSLMVIADNKKCHSIMEYITSDHVLNTHKITGSYLL